MKTQFYIFIYLLAFLVYFPASGQDVPVKRVCATMPADELLKQNPDSKLAMEHAKEQIQKYLKNRPNQRITGAGDVIPVVFHVVYDASMPFISDAQLKSQLDVLNQDFNRENPDTLKTPAVFKSVAGSPGIYFCPAILDEAGNPTNGITRTLTTKTAFKFEGNEIKFSDKGGKDAWNPDLYLNIWVGNLADDVIGYAQFPGGAKETDGVVLKYNVVGAKAFNPFSGPYTHGRTATHEIGHWLDLRHIWGEDDDSCTDSDLIDDTPNQAKSNERCPAFPKNSCPDSPFGDMFMNFMDYTDDACMNLFTKDQSARMLAALRVTRAPLLNSRVCSDEINADFRADKLAIFPGETTNFEYYSNGRRPESFEWEFEGGTPATSTQKNPQGIRYDAPGNYDVRLTVRDFRGSATEIKRNYIHVTTRELEIYPNPANDILTVSAPADQVIKIVRIYNTAGKLILHQTATERAITIAVRHLQNGLYVVQAEMESGDYLSRRLHILR